VLAKPLAAIVGAVLITGACGTALAQHQQHSPDRLDAVVSTMRMRFGMMNDTLPYDACSVFQKAGQPAAMVARIPRYYRTRLDRQDDAPCESPAPETRPGAGRSVRVDSVMIADSVAVVSLTIQRGEWGYAEHHDLRLTPDRRGWGVWQVRVIPGLRITP
jgi:hypothetical protein